MAAAAILKIVFLAITHRPCPISAKFCMRKQNGMSTRATWQKLLIFKIRWRTAAILKIVKSPYLSQKTSDFDEIWYTTSYIEPDYTHVTKNWNFSKIQDGDGRHLENRFLAITHQLIFWFQRNFALKSRTVCRQRPRDKKCKFLKSIAILKIVKSPYLSENINRFWQNLVYYSRYWTW